MTFEKETEKVKSTSKTSDLAMAWLCGEPQQATNKGHVLDLCDVWKRYCYLTTDTGIEIPQSYISRRSTFKDNLSHVLGSSYQFVPLKSGSAQERKI